MRRIAVVISLLAVVAMVVAGTVAAAAQEATPGAGLPVTPNPAECTVEGPTIDEVLARAGVTPIAGTPSAEGEVGATPEPFALPEGEVADEAMVAAITGTMREVLACYNAGNFLAYVEFLTDDGFREYAAEPISEEEVEFFRTGTPQVVPEAFYATLVAVREARVQEDGRVGALVDSIVAAETQVDFFIFEEQGDGTYLIDAVVEGLAGRYPLAGATPTA